MTPLIAIKSVTPVISYDCGCGFRSDVWKLAEAHAKEMGHSLTIHGRVIVEKDQYDDRPTLTREKRRGDRDA